MGSRPKITEEQLDRLNDRLERLGYRPDRMAFDTKIAYILDAAEKLPTNDPNVGATANPRRENW